jgi:hypothetical protein
MNLTAGELYFIRETDLRTTSQTDYVKIGLVKEVGDRTSEARAYEHQTGNPRQLHVVTVVKSHAISEVENIMHKLYAPWRVYGEWFFFKPAELKSAIKTAQELADEIASNVGNFQAVERYKKRVSTSKVLKPTPVVKSTHTQYLKADLRSKACGEIVQQVKDVFRTALENGESVSSMAEWRESAPREIFTLDLMMEAHPKIYEKYCIEEEFLSTRFSMTKHKETNLDIGKVDKSLAAFLVDMAKVIDNTTKGRVTKEALFEQYLRLLGLKARADLDKDVAQAFIQVACKTAAEIQGICKWKRELKSRTSFDMDAFSEAHPKLLKKFTETTQGEPALILNTKREYA